MGESQTLQPDALHPGLQPVTPNPLAGVQSTIPNAKPQALACIQAAKEIIVGSEL